MSMLLEAERVGVVYGRHKPVDDVSLSIGAGERSASSGRTAPARPR